MRVGFIGTGNMGRTLIEAFIQSGYLQQDQIVAHNRSLQKVERLAKLYPSIIVASSCREAASLSDILFICVKPTEYKTVLMDIQAVVRTHQIVISITSPVEIEDLERFLPCKIAKVIPSVTNAVLSGATLVMHGTRMDYDDEQRIFYLLSAISRPVYVDEKYTRIASDLASCSPAFLSYILQSLAEAAVQETGLPRESAVSLVVEMAQGVGRLLTEGGFTLESLQERVAVPGGITAEGLTLLKEELDGTFERLFHITHEKFHHDIEKVQQMWKLNTY